MATSRRRRVRRRPAATFIDHGVALAWGAWAELGVSGWTATHQSWASDLDEQVSSSTIRTVPVKARKALDRMVLDLDELGIDQPTATGADVWPALQTLGPPCSAPGHWASG